MIEERVRNAFSPSYFELINQSDLHAGHVGHDGSGHSHFKLIIVSPAFDEVPRVQRQRRVYSLLEDLFSEGLHALSMTLLTDKEYF
ncbi:MAG: BolA family transcriptional regulator [Alphaproteobacteria bacterium]|nr:BolA family transcriptional regulator [Alphaproteobacteria bacterium]